MTTLFFAARSVAVSSPTRCHAAVIGRPQTAGSTNFAALHQMIHHLALLIRAHWGSWHGGWSIGPVWQAGLVLLSGARQGAWRGPASMLAVTFGVPCAAHRPIAASLGAQPLAHAEALQQLRLGKAWAALVHTSGNADAAHDWLRQVREPGAVHDPVILVLSTLHDDTVQLASLQAGADAVLAASASAALIDAQLCRLERRAGTAAPAGSGDAGGLCLDARTHQVWAGTQSLALTPQLFRLLGCLMAAAPRVHTLATLHLAIGADAASQVESVHAYVSRPRKVLRPHRLDACIQTVHGVGYRYAPAAALAQTTRSRAATGVEAQRPTLA